MGCRLPVCGKREIISSSALAHGERRSSGACQTVSPALHEQTTLILPYFVLKLEVMREGDMNSAHFIELFFFAFFF